MGFLANMTRKRSQQISADGKDYTFTPGDDGSLTAPAPDAARDLIQPSRQVAKVVPSPLVPDSIRAPIAINPGPSPTLADAAAKKRRLYAMKVINGKQLYSD